MSVLQHNQILGCRGATLLQGEMTPLCWTQQGPIYFTELGYPPPDPDSINLAAAAAAGGRVGFALTTYLPVQLEIEEYSSTLFSPFPDRCQALCGQQLSYRDSVSPFTGLL